MKTKWFTYNMGVSLSLLDNEFWNIPVQFPEVDL